VAVSPAVVRSEQRRARARRRALIADRRLQRRQTRGRESSGAPAAARR